jgi:uncharacterized membrane protein YphA (DoxX/SURF4 family)
MNKDTGFAIVRILFGLAWAVDAAFKWMPAIRLNIIDVLTQAQAGQPALESAWIGLWVHMANFNPVAFGTLIAVVETLLALSLITGVFSKAAMYCGTLFALLIWSVPQGFGGPYDAGSTDIDSGGIYFLLFVALILGESWKRYTLETLFLKRS